MRPVIASPTLSKFIGGETALDHHKFGEFARASLARRKQREIRFEKVGDEYSRKDSFHYLFRGRDPETGREYGEAELGAESEMLIIAGSDTTSTVLAGSIFYLVHNPIAMQKLKDEVRNAFRSVEDIRYSNPTPSSLPYLRACIDETMRMTPPAPGWLPRKSLGATIDGEFFPAGTNVGRRLHLHNSS
jgi:cytochrome P450